MAPRNYDRYMLVIGAGRHVKLTDFTHAERCAWVFGVLSIAAQATIRGYLIVGDREAGAAEVARESAVSRGQAASALDKLQRVGMLEYDDALGAWFVHDWGDINPEPKKDATGTERQRRHRQRLRDARNGRVTP